MRLRKKHNIKYKIKLNYKTVLFKFIQTKKKCFRYNYKQNKKKVQKNSNTKTD